MANEVDASQTQAPADSLDAIALDRRKRRRTLLIGGGALLLVVGGGGFGLLRWQDAAATARVNGAWSAFSRCMIGPPLEPGESASRRFRSLQLATMNLPDDQRAPAEGKPWPDRCANLGHAVQEALHAAGRADRDRKDLAHWAEALAKQLKEKEPCSADLTEPIESAWLEASEARVSLVPAIQVAPPLVAATPLSSDALASVEPLSKSAFPLKAAHTDPHPGLVMRLLVEEKDVPRSPFLCTFPAAGAPRCAALPKAISGSRHGLRLLGTADDDAEPLVFAGNRGGDGVFRADSGEQVESIYSYGGYATKDGRSAVLGWNEAKRELRLTRKAGGGARVQETIEPEFRVGNFYYSSQILWDQVLLRGVTKEDERRLFALKVGWSGAPGEPLDVGELPEAGLITGAADEPPHIGGCRTAEATVVRVKGYDNDFMTFQVGGRWTKPVSPELTGGTLSCRKAEAAITRLELAGADAAHRTSITQSRCTSAGCRATSVRMEQLIGMRLHLVPKESHVDAVELDGKLLVVWAAGDRGGVRMRLAPAEQIAVAPDVVIYDDLVKDGRVQKLSTLFDLRLFSREGFAVLLLSTVQGVHALRVAPDGKVTPLPPAWAGG